MTLLEGDKLRDRLTGQSFIVKKVVDRTIILEAEGTPDRFYLGDAVVQLLFEKAQDSEDLNESSHLLTANQPTDPLQFSQSNPASTHPLTRLTMPWRKV